MNVKIGFFLMSIASVAGAAVVSAQEQPSEAPQTQVYVIKQGDTLWDLSASQLNSPWYWPRIWHVNPQITNPHRIYSGQTLTMPQADGQVATETAPPAAVAKAATDTTAPDQAGTPATAAVEVAQAPVADEEETPVVEEQAPDVSAESSDTMEVRQDLPGLPTESKLQGAIQSKIASRRMYVRLGSEGFLSRERVKAAASVVGSHLEKMMYTQHDKVFISLGEGSGVEVGQRFTAYQILQEVRHPVSGAAVGVRIKQLGILEVQQVHEEVSTAKIITAYDAVDKEALLMPFEPYEKTIYPQPTPEELSGYVVATSNDVIMTGEHQVIYVDRGTDDNLNIGQTFEIFKPAPKENDILTRRSLKVPDKVVGAGIVVDAGPRTATVLIWNSRDVIEIGDRIRPLAWQAFRTY